jgi:hypothetical protein
VPPNFFEEYLSSLGRINLDAFGDFSSVDVIDILLIPDLLRLSNKFFLDGVGEFILE